MDLILLYFASFLAFALIGWDKHLKECSTHRIPEAVLLLSAVAFGAFGALCGMILFEHKTDKSLFKVGVPVLVALQLGFFIFLRVVIGTLLDL